MGRASPMLNSHANRPPAMTTTSTTIHQSGELPGVFRTSTEGVTTHSIVAHISNSVGATSGLDRRPVSCTWTLSTTWSTGEARIGDCGPPSRRTKRSVPTTHDGHRVRVTLLAALPSRQSLCVSAIHDVCTRSNGPETPQIGVGTLNRNEVGRLRASMLLHAAFDGQARIYFSNRIPCSDSTITVAISLPAKASAQSRRTVDTAATECLQSQSKPQSLSRSEGGLRCL